MASGKMKHDLDRISALPDAVLHEVLSLLDMKEVIQASLLSLRWRYLWKSLPIINCDYTLWMGSDIKFMDFVDKVLLLRDDSKIMKLQLCCYYPHHNNKRIDSWITSARSKGLQHLDLQIYDDDDMTFYPPLELPGSLFCSDITVLELRFCYIQFPNLICSLNGIKTLELVGVRLPEGNSRGELVLSCPSLENLKMKKCIYKSLRFLKISMVQLKTFAFVNYQGCTRYCQNCQIEICAPSLQSLDVSFYSKKDPEFRMINLTSLVTAKLAFGGVDIKFIVDCIQAISHAKTIDLYVEKIKRWVSFDNQRMISHSNPRSLKLRGGQGCFACIKIILEKFPCIEHLVILVEDYFIQENIFGYQNHHLEDVEIEIFAGNESAIACLKSLLCSAQALKKLVIRMNEELYSFEKKILSSMVLRLPRASTTTVVTFLD